MCFQTRNMSDASLIASASRELQTAWGFTAKKIVSQNFSVAQLSSLEVRKIAVRHDRTPAQVLVRWTVSRLDNNQGTIKLPATLTPRKIAQLFDVENWALADKEMAQLRVLSGEPAPGPEPAPQPTASAHSQEWLDVNPAATRHKTQWLDPAGTPAPSALDASLMTLPRRKKEPEAALEEEPTLPEPAAWGDAIGKDKVLTGRVNTVDVSVARRSCAKALMLSMAELKELAGAMKIQYPQGNVTKPQLIEVLVEKHDDQVRVQEYADLVFQGFDVDGNGVIDHAEFMTFLSAASESDPRKQLEAVFRMFDTDSNGSLDVKELENMLRVMAKLDPDNGGMDGADPEIIAEMMHMEFDDDMNGDISVEEFIGKCGDNGLLGDLLKFANLDSVLGLGLRKTGKGPRQTADARRSSQSSMAGSDISVNSSASQVKSKRANRTMSAKLRS